MKFIKKIAALSLIAFAAFVYAFDFTPSEQEFNSWGQRCQALYLSTGVGKRSEFVGRLPSEIVKRERALEVERRSGGWHYCAGVIYIKRAKAEFKDIKRREFLFERAVDEVNFTVNSINRDDPWFAEIGVTQGNLFKDLGLYNKAEKILSEIVQRFPAYDQAFLAKSLLYRKMGDKQKAIKLLENLGKERIENSIEISYFLGFLYAEEKVIDKAEYYAKVAYKLGYPLPGLKNMIIKLKHNR